MGLPPGDVTLREVLEWAQEQAQFLSPTQHHVLLYLVANAFISDRNPEGRRAGDVYSGRCALSKIAHRTGISDKAIRYTLQALQDQGYVLAQLRSGHGKSKISVFWTEGADEMRAEFRSGAKPLPREFNRTVRTPQKQVHLAPVLDIRTGKPYRNTR